MNQESNRAEPTNAGPNVPVDAPQGGFGNYLREHIAVTRGSILYGLVVSIVLAPPLSLLQPQGWIVTVALVVLGGLGLLFGGLYLGGRFFAYFVGGRRSASPEETSFSLAVAFTLAVGLICLSISATVDAMTPRGWFVAAVPILGQAQSSLFDALPGENPVADSELAIAQADTSAVAEPAETTSAGGTVEEAVPAVERDPPGGRRQDATATVPDSSDGKSTSTNPFESTDETAAATPAPAAEAESPSAVEPLSVPEPTAPTEPEPEPEPEPETKEPARAADAFSPDEPAGKTADEVVVAVADTEAKEEVRGASEAPRFHRGGEKLVAVKFKLPADAPGEKQAKRSYGAPIRLANLYQPTARTQLMRSGECLLIEESRSSRGLRARDLFSNRVVLLPASTVTAIRPVKVVKEVPFAHQMRFLTYQILSVTLPQAGRVVGVKGDAAEITVGVEDGLEEGDELAAFEIQANGTLKRRDAELSVNFFEETGSQVDITSGADVVQKGDLVVSVGKSPAKLVVFPFRMSFEGVEQQFSFQSKTLQRRARGLNVAQRKRLIDYCHDRGKDFADKIRLAIATLGVAHADDKTTNDTMEQGFSGSGGGWNAQKAFVLGELSQSNYAVFGDIEPRRVPPPADCVIRLSVMDLIKNELVYESKFTLNIRQLNNLRRWKP
ncbi:MAG: hypothetical protein CMJ75_20770 [Planctomycetaceae bacterium]|nr:hypothetical protein [Planctomycetaceae bacterium]